MKIRPFAPAAEHSASTRWYELGAVLALAEPAEQDSAAVTTADVYVFGPIGGWIGADSDDFVRDVASLDVDQIVLHLNSPGGDAMEGVAIANVLRAHRARVVVRVDGMAASAASVIAMAGDEIVMGIGSTLMIHDSWGYAVGNAAEIAAYGRRLDATSNSIASTYAARTGGTAEAWREVMRAEAWYTAEEAVTAGLADRVAAVDETGTAEGEQVRPGSSSGDFWSMWDSLRDPGRFDLSAFTYAGRQHAPAPVMPERQTPAASAVGPIPHEKGGDVAFSDDLLSTMRQRLGVAADADEATIVAAMTEALDERAEPAAKLPDGVVTIEKATLEELQAHARRGDEARTRQERETREQLVSAAVSDGRISPARREHWAAQLEADPGASAVLAGLEKGLIPVGAEIGHAGNAGDPEADALYASVFGKES